MIDAVNVSNLLQDLISRKRVPSIVSAEAAECGLACIAMIARHHGHDVDLNGLRQRFPGSMSGSSLASVMRMAESLSLTTRALRTDLNSLRRVNLPAILHWDLNHFVVLERVTRSGLVIHDPASGRKIISLEEASGHYTGVLLELRRANDFEPVSAKIPVRLKSLWQNMTGFWKSFYQILVFSAVLQILVFVAPLYNQIVVDDVLQRGDENLLAILAMGFALVAIVRVVVQVAREYTLQVISQLLSFQLVGNIVRHLLRLDLGYFEKRHVGDIMSRIQSTQPIQDAFSRGFVATLIDGVMAVIALVIMAFYSGLLTMVVAASLILTTIVTFSFYPVIRRRSERAITTKAEEQTHLIESVRAAQTLKIMARETEREADWRNLFLDSVRANFSVGKLEIYRGALQSAINGLQTVGIIYLAAQMILDGAGFSIGMLFAFLSYKQTFTDRSTALINQLFQFRLLNLHLDRLGDIVCSECEVVSAELPAETKDFRGEIELQHVSFRYGQADAPVLTDASFCIAPGEFVAFTGPSGGGKTTILKLILGLHAPSSGKVLLDGQPATATLSRQWRRRSGVVMQNDSLLSGTLAENIAFFDPDMDMTQVVAAAVAAQIHDEIARMPMQYMSVVGDMGAALSAGQRQRMMLARALYRRPQLLVLDEGTANVDIEAEMLIAKAIREQSITRVIVAHRPALIDLADRVFEVRSGQVSVLSD